MMVLSDRVGCASLMMVLSDQCALYIADDGFEWTCRLSIADDGLQIDVQRHCDDRPKMFRHRLAGSDDNQLKSIISPYTARWAATPIIC